MPLNNDDIKQLIAILQRGLGDNAPSDEEPEPVKKTTTTRKRPSSPKPKKSSFVNKFDKMPEFKMCKEDVEIDRKIRKPPPSERKPPFEFIKVQCRVCGKKEKVAPDLIESIERYKCNKCSTGAG